MPRPMTLTSEYKRWSAAFARALGDGETSLHGSGAAWFIGLVIVLAHGMTLFLPLTGDDIYVLIEQADQPIAELVVEPVLAHVDNFEPTFWRPLTLLSYKVTWHLFGFVPFWYHLLDVALHFLVSLSVFLVSRQVGLGRWSLAAAVLFGAHPSMTSVVWANSYRHDLLAGLFVLITLWAILRGGRWAIVALLAWPLALISKEISFAALPVLIYLGWRNWRLLAWLLTGTVAVLLLRSHFVTMAEFPPTEDTVAVAAIYWASALFPYERVDLLLPLIIVGLVGMVAVRVESAAVRLGALLSGSVWVVMAASSAVAIRSSYLSIAGLCIVLGALAADGKRVLGAGFAVVVLVAWLFVPPRWPEIADRDQRAVAASVSQCEPLPIDRLPHPEPLIHRDAHLTDFSVESAVAMECGEESL